MSRIICVANQKGGVGKTTTAINLAASLAKKGKPTLLIDLDPQGNASSGLGLKHHQFEEKNIYHAIIGTQDFKEVIYPTATKNLFVAPANNDLVGAEIELIGFEEREFRLKKLLSSKLDEFQYVIIDCPPSLGLLTINALSAANTFLVPLQCEYFALEGLSQLLNTAGLVRKNLNPNLRIEGIVLTMFDTRNNLSHQVVTEIRNHFGDKVFSSIIPRNVRLSEAPSHGKTIEEYDPKSVGALRYFDLANEIEEKTQCAEGSC